MKSSPDVFQQDGYGRLFYNMNMKHWPLVNVFSFVDDDEENDDFSDDDEDEDDDIIPQVTKSTLDKIASVGWC